MVSPMKDSYKMEIYAMVCPCTFIPFTLSAFIISSLYLSVTLFLLTVHFLSVDITVYIDGFHGDLNETFFVGKVDERSEKLVRVAYECMMKGIQIGKLHVLVCVCSCGLL